MKNSKKNANAWISFVIWISSAYKARVLWMAGYQSWEILKKKNMVENLPDFFFASWFGCVWKQIQNQVNSDHDRETLKNVHPLFIPNWQIWKQSREICIYLLAEFVLQQVTAMLAATHTIGAFPISKLLDLLYSLCM